MQVKKSSEVIYWGIFLVLMIFKYGYYRFEYFPVMDDWIQYGTYSMFENSFVDVILKTKMYTIRPLAGLLDVYIIGKFWNNMGLVFFVMTMLHAFSAYFLVKIFKYNGIKTGFLFLIIYGLLPFGSEATYWISASSRLVVGMFLTALALFFLCKYIYEEKTGALFMYLFFLLLSGGFYEQITIMSFVGVLLILLPNFKKTKAKIALLLSIIPYAIVGSYYSYFSTEGQLASRGKTVELYKTINYQKTYDAIREMISNSDIYFYIRGFNRGLDIIITNKSSIFLLTIVLISIGMYFLNNRRNRERKFLANVKKIIIGVIFLCAPFIIFFLLQFNWISFRNAFPSFIGLALIIEGTVDTMTKNIAMQRCKSFLISILTFVFIVINISEITDYKNVSSLDKSLCTGIISVSEESGLLEGEKFALLLDGSTTKLEFNKNYHEHINSIKDSYWSLTGTLRGVAKKPLIKNVVPIKPNQSFVLMPKDYYKYILLGIDESNNVHLLTYERENEYLYFLYKVNGDMFGIIEYRYKHGFFSKK